jgi:hypothetical protein
MKYLRRALNFFDCCSGDIDVEDTKIEPNTLSFQGNQNFSNRHLIDFPRIENQENVHEDVLLSEYKSKQTKISESIQLKGNQEKLSMEHSDGDNIYQEENFTSEEPFPKRIFLSMENLIPYNQKSCAEEEYYIIKYGESNYGNIFVSAPDLLKIREDDLCGNDSGEHNLENKCAEHNFFAIDTSNSLQ